MSQRVHNRVNAGLVALSATAVVAGPVLAAAPASAQAPEVLRSSAAVQLAADSYKYKDNSDAELLGLTAQRAAGSIALTPVTLGVAAYSVIFGDQQTLADTLGAALDAPQYALDPTLELLSRFLPAPIGGTDGDPRTTGKDEGQLQQFRANVLLAARDTLKGYAAAFATKTPNANVNPAATLIAGIDGLTAASWDALAASPKNLSKFLTDVSSGNNVNAYQDIKSSLETPLGISSLVSKPTAWTVTTTVANPDGSFQTKSTTTSAAPTITGSQTVGNTTTTVAPSAWTSFGSLSNGTNNLNHGLESATALALGVKLDSAYTAQHPYVKPESSSLRFSSGADNTGGGGSTGGSKTPLTSLSQALSKVTKSFVPKPATAKEAGAKPSADHETGGKHRAPDSGDK